MASSSIDERRSGRGRWRRPSAWLLASLAAFALAAGAQEETEEEPPPASTPSGVASLWIDGRRSSLPFTLGARGPLFALPPLAARLGATLRVGPLGESHTLIFDDKQYLFGTDGPQLVIVGEGEQQILTLSVTPARTADGLAVPLDLLERTYGDELGYEFTWDRQALRLEVARRSQRELGAAINLVQQGRVTTIEVAFTAVPRYRVERTEGSLEIHLLGDRLGGFVRGADERDALVPAIVVSPSRLRFELAEGAAAAEPRLIEVPPRLIVEVFRQTAAQGPAADDPATGDDGLRTIVIDPGHGGEESGAIGPSGTQEKDLTLVLARALQRQLERRLPVKVVLTRDSDVDVPLDTRPAIANQNKGDLFISLHLNASFGARAHGAETYFLSREASDQRAAEAAEAENRWAGDDPEADLRLILWDLAQSYHLGASQRLGNLVQEELNQALGLRDRGVKQAPFRVLMGADMPAVLVELGFLSNPEEETKLQSTAYRAELVDALVRAIVRFRAQLEARSGGGEGRP